MQPVVITVEGEYYDSQIYSGRLYLWTLDGTIKIIDWDALLDSFSVGAELQLPLDCAFRRSEYLYGSAFAKFFQDIEIKQLLVSKFNRLAGFELHVAKSRLQEFLIREQDNPFPFPHSDTQLYKNSLFSSSKSGVYQSPINKRNVNPIKKKAERLWDCSVLGMSVSYSRLNLSAGSQGLYALYPDAPFFLDRTGYGKDDVLQLSSVQSNSNKSVYYGVFSSSSVGPGQLIDFEKERLPEENNKRPYRLKHRRNISSQELVQQATFSWGSMDKLCIVHNGMARIIRYSPWETEDESRIESLSDIELVGDRTSVVSADSAYFGYVIEYDDGLLVIASNGERRWFDGEVVNWRLFPRATYYQNQLHVIGPEALSVYSFNHDYFEDQDAKVVGLRYFTR